MNGTGFGFPWYLVACFWILVTLFFVSPKFRWLLNDMVRLSMNKKSEPYRAKPKKNEVLTDNKLNKNIDEYHAIFEALKGLGYTTIEAKEGTEYATTVFPKSDLKTKIKESLSYFYQKKHDELPNDETD